MFVIGDAHISNNIDYIKFFEVVNELLKHDTVVLLGDIIDFTKVEITKLNWKVQDFNHPNLVYVTGNHDIIVDELDIPCCNVYMSEAGIRFEHGHRFEARLASNFFVQPEEFNNMFRTLCYSKSSVNKLSHGFWQLKTKFSRKPHAQIKDDMIREMYRIESIVCAHTHAEAFNQATKTLIIDDYVDKKMVYYIDENEFQKSGKFVKFCVNGESLTRIRDTARKLKSN